MIIVFSVIINCLKTSAFAFHLNIVQIYISFYSKASCVNQILMPLFVAEVAYLCLVRVVCNV